jgi:N-acetylglucosamine-6-sulfatase
LALALLAALVVVGRHGEAIAQAGRPNIVVIVTDDQTYTDLYERAGRGSGAKVMPKTRRLIGGKGVTFRRAYASNPMSCPSRSSLLTGQYSHNHRNVTNVFPSGKYCSHRRSKFDLRTTLPVWLRAAGYRTLHFGRFLNAFGLGRPHLVPPGWNWWVQPVETKVSSTAVYTGYRLNVNGALTHKFGRKDRPSNRAYFTRVITQMALHQVARGDLSKPFYLALDHRAPHEDEVKPVGPQPQPRHASDFRGKAPRFPPNYNEGNVSDKAPWLRHAAPLSGRNQRKIKVRNVRRLRTLRSVDDSVGRVVRRLRRLGELDETYIFFVSDNGFMLGEHRISKGKFRPYEESSHVPLLVRGPGVPRGRVSRELVTNVDLAPTLAALAGASPTRLLDGRSLLPFMRKPALRSRRPILLEGYPPGRTALKKKGHGATRLPEPTPPNWQAIVRGRWKLVHYHRQGFELYDLKRDRFELGSLDGKRRYRKVLRRLNRRLRKLRRCDGAACNRPMRAPRPPKR